MTSFIGKWKNFLIEIIKNITKNILQKSLLDLFGNKKFFSIKNNRCMQKNIIIQKVFSFWLLFIYFMTIHNFYLEIKEILPQE